MEAGQGIAGSSLVCRLAASPPEFLLEKPPAAVHSRSATGDCFVSSVMAECVLRRPGLRKGCVVRVRWHFKKSARRRAVQAERANSHPFGHGWLCSVAVITSDFDSEVLGSNPSTTLA